VFAVMMVLHERGANVLVPFGENTRYDLVLDDGGGVLLRIQCKAGRPRNGAVCFFTASSYGHRSHPQQMRRTYVAEVDAFGVYCAETGAVYLVPIRETKTGTQAALRVLPARNGQRDGIRIASDYEIGSVVVTSTRARARTAALPRPP